MTKEQVIKEISEEIRYNKERREKYKNGTTNGDFALDMMYMGKIEGLEHALRYLKTLPDEQD